MEGPLKPVSSDALASQVVHLARPEELTSRLTELDLRTPRPVLVLVGGADGLTDAQLTRLRPLFEEGLAPLADALGACVIDGGTDAGVMALIGQARAKLGASFPLIGVTASGTIKPDDSADGRAVAASLEPNHTHVVLVPGAKWGDESQWLADVASWVASDAQSVTVVVNGGKVTVDDAERSVTAGRPVLVVAGSGRAADELAAALQEPSQDQRAAKLAGSGLVEVVDLADGPQAIARAVAAVLTTAPARPPSSTGDQDRL